MTVSPLRFEIRLLLILPLLTLTEIWMSLPLVKYQVTILTLNFVELIILSLFFLSTHYKITISS